MVRFVAPFLLVLALVVSVHANSESTTIPAPPTRKPRIKVKIVESLHGASNQATPPPPQYNYGRGQQFNQQPPTIPPMPIAMTPPAHMLNAFEGHTLPGILNVSSGYFVYHLSLFESLTFDYQTATTQTNGTLGVFKHWDRDTFHAHYWLAKSECMVTADVHLQCGANVVFAFSQLTDCTSYFTLKCPQACSFQMGFSDASKAEIPQKLVKASALLASKVSEFEEKVELMKQEIEEYKNCVEFAAGRVSETRSKTCIELIGRDLPSSAIPSTPSTHPAQTQQYHQEGQAGSNQENEGVEADDDPDPLDVADMDPVG
eukprot:TRINITY_DN914_c0_g2_i3.p1 TRINITY_DN914_c0_g2~~TRINITY_DN914_c0_g2_i3.p1  ORF type:complete len:316 (-),score=78.60 TRINITY_DN914_c0_g2_i3:99-1046(-)